MYQNNHLKQKSKLLSILSLVLEVKGFKHDYIFKNIPFYISFVSFDIFPSRSEYSKKESLKKGSNLATPNFFQCVT